VHSEIEKVVCKLFQDGHYREGVLNSYIRVIEAVKEKSRIQDDGDSLIGRAFGRKVGDAPRVQFKPSMLDSNSDAKS
jgi:hypothetical protein